MEKPFPTPAAHKKAFFQFLHFCTNFHHTQAHLAVYDVISRLRRAMGSFHRTIIITTTRNKIPSHPNALPLHADTAVPVTICRE